MDSVGMMEGAFFVPKTELLAWLARDFNLGLSKVEECASGAVYIQIVDKIFFGKVPMHKVKWDAKFDYQFIDNYKLLQQVFSKFEVKKVIDVDKLIKARCQDNLEFLQWMKAFYDRMGGGDADYDAIERRQISGCNMPDWAKPKNAKLSNSGPNPKPKAGPRSMPSTGGTGALSQRKSSVSNPATAQQIADLKEQVAVLQGDVETAEKERDFYFGKLRQLEILCQAEGKKELTLQEIEAVLYADDSNSETPSPEPPINPDEPQINPDEPQINQD
eukprot:Selendium_serpulae@DN3372_c0_g1_i1.p1